MFIATGQTKRAFMFRLPDKTVEIAYAAVAAIFYFWMQFR